MSQSVSLEKLKQEHILLTINENISDYTSYDNIKNPYNFKSWWNTIASSTDAPYETRTQIYEAALHYLPASYKIWFHYLTEAREHIMTFPLYDRRYEVINNLHERALLTMHKMPRIWLDYASFLIYQNKITKTRKVFDEALKSLPVTQHEKIWKAYIEWAKEVNVPMMTSTVIKRYTKLNPDAREEFVYFMIKNEQFNQASKLIIDILNDDMFNSKLGKSKYHYWLLLCEMIETYPEQVKELDCESIIRNGLTKYTDEIGRLWVALSNFYIKLGVFGKARDIFEEALTKVLTARDFTLIFNAYITFEEEVAFKNLEGDVEIKEDDNMDEEDEFNDILEEAFTNLNIKDTSSDKNNNIVPDNSSSNPNTNFKLLRLLNLLERRPFLLSSTLLRQNPNSVKEWLKRVKLCKDYSSTIATYESALSTINPELCNGKLSEVYLSLANYYESFNDIAKANETYYRATEQTFKKTEENVSIWCNWAEMHLRYNNYKDAYIIAKTVCTSRKYSSYNKSIKLWSLYVDLEASIGTIENTRAIYDKMLEMKIATLQTVFNYCAFLESHSYYEETFRIYEQAIDYFTWPSLYDIYIVYVKKLIKRYKGEKIERVRDLFDQIKKSCPKDKIKIFYYMFSDYEEKYGLLNHAIGILSEGALEVEKSEKAEVFSVLISKTAKYFGITKTRSAFDKAMDELEGEQVVEIGLKYASIETKLGEVDRARGIYTHLSQFCDPNKEEFKEEFWEVWEKFEITNGNVETYQEMESIKRSVRSKFSLNVPMFNSNNKM